MDITEVRIKLMDDPQDRLLAFCSITFDQCFVVRDLKIIQGTKGAFVAMPSRKLTDRCPRCGTKNHLRACYCNQCGTGLAEDRSSKDGDGRAKLYADIAHPINSACRESIQARVLEAYEVEVQESTKPDYVCRYDDYGEDDYDDYQECEEQPAARQYRGAGERTHRIEPAEEEQTGPHSAPAVKRASVHQTAGRDEDFGEGLV